MSRILRALRTCGLIIVLSITLVLVATAYILFSDSAGAQQSVTVPTVAGSETRQGEATSLFDTATPIQPTGPPNSTPVFSSSAPIRPTDTPVPPTATPIPPPTRTPIPPTSALLFATSTPIHEAETPIAPSPTSIPPSATPVSPSRTPLPPTVTPVPSTRTPIPPSATAIPPSPTPVPLSRTPHPPTVTEIPPTATESFPLTMYSSPLRKYVRGIVNLRQGPGTSYRKIGLVTAGTQIEVIGQSGDWYLVMHNHGEAFIAGWLTYDVATSTPTPAPTATRASPTKQTIPLTRYSQPLRRFTHGTVNVRKGPGTSYDLVGSVSVNAALQVIGKSGDWYLIRHNGREVFIAGWLTHRSRLVQPSRQQTSGSSSQPVVKQPIQQPVQQPVARVQQPAQSEAPAQPAYSCNCSKTCGAMSSCREAYFQLNNCGCRRRDGDNDGVPCESICR